jgi:hypothetical protein
MMLDLLSPGGRLVVLSDILELQTSDPRLSALTRQIEQKSIDEEFLRALIDEEGLGLAFCALADLEARLDVQHSGYYLWPFDEEKSYVVKSVSGKR